jgi:hypothetical protein
MRCPLNLNSNNHNQRDGSRRFYLAILQPGQLRHLDRFCLFSETVFHASAGLRYVRKPIVHRCIGRPLLQC